jgi:hypothetical protein
MATSNSTPIYTTLTDVTLHYECPRSGGQFVLYARHCPQSL